MVFDEHRRIFSSSAPALRALVRLCARPHPPTKVVVFDAVVGRAAALLMTLLKPTAVFGIVGAANAAAIFKRQKIPYHFCRMVPFVLNAKKTGPCRHDTLSRGRTPRALLHILRGSAP